MNILKLSGVITCWPETLTLTGCATLVLLRATIVVKLYRADFQNKRKQRYFRSRQKTANSCTEN